MQKLENVTQDKVTVNIGDIVHRHLLNDDFVMFNRQPSLHKMSFMAHRVKVLPYSTFRLNLCCTRPYNADFDGDEMNCHEPQSYQAISELQEIMLVSKQIVSCKNNAPLISIVQDSLVGAFMLTQRDVFISKQDFQKYMGFLEYPSESYRPNYGTYYEDLTNDNAVVTASGHLSMTMSATSAGDQMRANVNMTKPLICITTPQPAILWPKPQWTGKQLFSMGMPTKMNLIVGQRNTADFISDKTVSILNGELLTGIASSKLVGQAQGGLIHVLWKDHSADACKAFLNNCQRTMTQMMIDVSFSVGLGDMVISAAATANAAELNN